jgi:hypothetical protein
LVQFSYFRTKTDLNRFFSLARVFSVWLGFFGLVFSIFFNFLNLINFFIVLLIHRSDGRVLLLFLELIRCLIISKKKMIRTTRILDAFWRWCMLHAGGMRRQSYFCLPSNLGSQYSLSLLEFNRVPSKLQPASAATFEIIHSFWAR